MGLPDRAEWLNAPEKLILFSRLILPTNPTQVTISFSMVLHFAKMPRKLFFSVDIRMWKINLFCADYGIPRHAEVEFKAFVYIKKPHTPTNTAKPWLWIFMLLQTIKEPRRDWYSSVGLCLQPPISDYGITIIHRYPSDHQIKDRLALSQSQHRDMLLKKTTVGGRGQRKWSIPSRGTHKLLFFIRGFIFILSG